MNIADRIAFVSRRFGELFSAEPTVWSRAPGRVDLMGSHTDYNLGYVMTMTIDRDTWVAARARKDRRVCIASANMPGISCFSLNEPISRDVQTPWSDYVRGMAAVLSEAGYPLHGFDGFVHSTVPFGSGLSSSAAIEMAVAVTFKQVSGFEMHPVEMARLGQLAENGFVGVNTGILDQYSSAMGIDGSAIQLDCRSLTSKNVRIADGLHVVICDTRAERSLIGSEYDDRRTQCEEGVRILHHHYPTIEALRDVTLEQLEAHEAEMPAVVAKRSRFIIEESQRVLDLALVLPGGDPDALAELFAASYAGACDLYEICAPAMTMMMAVMRSAPGVVAARQTGAGFGGCMVALVTAGYVADFSEHVRNRYGAESGIEPHVYEVSASAGAGPLPPI